MASGDSDNSIPVNPLIASLLYDLLLRQQAAAGALDEETDSEGEKASNKIENENQVATSMPMPTPIRMPQPSAIAGADGPVPGGAHNTGAFTRPTMPLPQLHTAGLASSSTPPPIPGPSFPNIPISSATPPAKGSKPNASPKPAPVRPSSPTNLDVATTTLVWQLHFLPLSNRIVEALYEGDNSLPPLISGRIAYLKLDGYSSRDTTENMCALIRFLQEHKWEDQTVDVFIATMRGKPHWPKKLANAPDEDHVKHTWSLIEGLLATYAFKNHLLPSPPPTFHGIVERIFPDLPDITTSRFLRVRKRVVKPQSFSFSVRDLLGEDFIIEPTDNMIDHLELHGSIVKVFVLDARSVKVLMSYHQNRAAQAIGMSNFGNEILQSYQALTASEFQENFKLPISLGMFKIDPDSAKTGFDDLTVVTGVIRVFHNQPNFDPKPQLLASRVHAIETALGTRRHWYKRLRRDIHKRKKEEPWMFWGAVLAVFFGVCTVIQTITSVWSLVLSAAS